MPHSTLDESSLNHKDLIVNDGKLPAELIGYCQPTTLDTPMSEVRRRYNEDGYVLLKGLLPRQDVLRAREQYFSLLSPSGVLKPGTQAVQGVFDLDKDPADYPGIGAGGVEANGRPTGPHPEVADQFVDLALKAHTEPWYQQFCEHKALRDFIAEFTGWNDDCLGVRRTLIRNNTPGNKAIGVHYDQIFLRHGRDDAVTAWVPIGDVKIHGGGLIYLEKSHKLGQEIEADFTKKARESGMTEEETRNAFNQNMMSGGMLAHGPIEFAHQVGRGRKWLCSEYEAGDVVLHDSYMIHASTMNTDEEGVIRVGTDLRFVDKSKKWDKRWANDFRFGDGV